MSGPRFALRFALGSMAALAVACSQEVARTEIIVRVDADDQVIQRMRGGKLQVTVHTESLPGEAGLDRREFLVGDLVWPADVHVVPARSNDRSDPIEIVVDALDSGGKALVEQRVRTTFEPRKKHVLSLRLRKCGPSAYYDLCTPQSSPCHGSQCLTCREDTNACGETPLLPGSGLPGFEPSAGPHDPGPTIDGGPDLPRDAPGPGQDGGAVAQLSDAAADGAGALASSDAMVSALPDASDAAGVVESDGSDAMPPPAHPDCTMAPRWITATASALIPAEARPLSHVNIPPGGPLYDQYVCRVPDGTGGVIPGKVNAIGGSSNFGCYYASPGIPSWRGLPVDTTNQTFELLVPVAGCTLSLVHVSHTNAQPLPANAVVTGQDDAHAPLYSCSVNMIDPRGPSTGQHFGRVSAAVNDPCRLQFFTEVPPTSTSFDILVQTPD